QEKVIAQAAEEVREAIQNARGEFSNLRRDIAGSMGGDNFDETAMGNAFARQDELIGKVRKAVTGALAKTHEALDARQRARLAELIAQGPWGGGRGGPYRGASAI